MSEPEGFAARWSRLKRATAKEQQEAASAQSATPSAHGPAEGDLPRTTRKTPPDGSEPSDTPFDPKSLPPIESITAASDIRAFLQAGVPKELTRAALRRVWTADPAIRDFIGLAENQWDFTDPAAMPGFGPLEPTDDIRQLVAQAMGRLGDLTGVTSSERVASVSERAQMPQEAPVACAPPLSAQMNSVSEEETNAETAEQEQHRVEVDDFPPSAPAKNTGETHNRRAHGGALPK